MRYKKGFSLLEVNIAIVITIIIISFLLKLFIVNINIKQMTLKQKKAFEVIEMVKNEVRSNLNESEITSTFINKKFINKDNLDFENYSTSKFLDILDDYNNEDNYMEIKLVGNKNMNIKLHIFENKKETDIYETNFTYK
ncbi:MAG: prepilin-type N-terminal cleavage/methylation domain-containing protein [Clostridiaceae bacterium]